MRISSLKLDEMFSRAGVSKELFHNSLKTMGVAHIKGSRMKAMWKEDRPTINYCYVACEFAYWYACRDNRSSWKVYTCNIPSLPGIKHWFMKNSLGEVIDLTADQFDNHAEIDYNNSRRSGFIQSGCIGPSRRARLLASLMGYDEDEWKDKGRTLDEGGIV